MTPKLRRVWRSATKATFTAFSLMVLVSACQKTDEKVSDAKEAVVDAQGEVAEANQDLKEANREKHAEWQENWLSFKRDIDKEVSENERHILDLRAQVAHVDARYQDGYNERINEVERRNDDLRDRVANYENHGDADWDAFKTSIRRDFDAVGASIRDIAVSNG